MNEAKEESLDFVESALMAKIEEGNLRAIIFFLKTKAKSRGYSEKTEIDLKQDYEPVVIYLSDNGRNPELTKKLEKEKLKRDTLNGNHSN